MAITLARTKVSANLGNVVSSAIVAVKAARRGEQSRREAEFQRAIADGLSYDEQVKFREKQLEDEKASSFTDPDYTASLEKSVADTKKLSRFSKYRTRYAQTLGELSAGKINEEDYLSILENQLGGVQDSDLRLEIEGDVATAREKVKQYKDTILSNRVKKAKYDGTEEALTDVIDSVTTARSRARISDNEDDVSAYDETLSALNSQLSTVRVQDSITEFQVHSSTRGTSPTEKLDYINAQLRKADPDTSVRIGDRTYASAQQFWTLERDDFLAGTSQVFGNFFDELKAQTENNFSADTNKFGHPTQAVLEQTLSTFNGLRAKPEIAPFLGRLDSVQSGVMNDAVDTVASRVLEIGSQNLDFQNTDIQLQNLSRYGDVERYRIELRNRNVSAGEESQKLLGAEEAASRAVKTDLEIPVITASQASSASTPPLPAYDSMTGALTPEGKRLGLPEVNQPKVEVTPASKPEPTPTPASKPTPVVTPTPSEAPKSPATPTPAPAVSYQTYVIKAGDTLSGIAQRLLGSAGRYTELATLNNIADPNKIQAGATLKYNL